MQGDAPAGSPSLYEWLFGRGGCERRRSCWRSCARVLVNLHARKRGSWPPKVDVQVSLALRLLHPSRGIPALVPEEGARENRELPQPAVLLDLSKKEVLGTLHLNAGEVEDVLALGWRPHLLLDLPVERNDAAVLPDVLHVPLR